MNNLYLKKVNPYKSIIYKAEGFCIAIEIKNDNNIYYSKKNHHEKNINNIYSKKINHKKNFNKNLNLKK